MPRSRSTFIQSDRARRCLATRLDRTRKLDGTAEQQQLFGQRCLAGIRVGDDREGTPPGDRIGQIVG